MSKNYKNIFIEIAIICCMIFMMMGCVTIKEMKVPTIKDFGPSNYIQTEYHKIDNDTPLDLLLSQEYELSDLHSFFGKYLSQGAGMLKGLGEKKYRTWQEVDAQFPIQCLRYNTNTHYTVYKTKEGGYYYVFWQIISDNSHIVGENKPEKGISVLSTTYINELPSYSQFKALRKKISSAADVLEIDPNMEMDFFSSSIRSYSLLNDKRVILIEYSHNKFEKLDDLIVTDIMVYPKDSKISHISYIRTEDLP